MKIDFSFKGRTFTDLAPHFRAQFAADLVPKWRRFADARAFSSFAASSGIDVGKNLEDLVEPRRFSQKCALRFPEHRRARGIGRRIPELFACLR